MNLGNALRLAVVILAFSDTSTSFAAGPDFRQDAAVRGTMNTTLRDLLQVSPRGTQVKLVQSIWAERVEKPFPMPPTPASRQAYLDRDAVL